jgi:aryl-alcohol dehydrogenase-like predicted oxidoreductase
LKLGLGTAQFGQVYGIANEGEAVTDKTAGEILAFAGSHDIGLLDTAVDYGRCESLLGAIGVSTFDVVSKLPGMPVDVHQPATWVKENIAHSRQRLGLDYLYGLLLHRPQELLGPKGETLYEAVKEEQVQGHVGKIGVSVYHPEELETITGRFNVDIVQLPCNVLDHRFLDTGWMDRLKASGTEVHVRSAFLQGLLLMDSQPEYFKRWREIFRVWREWLSDNRLDPVDACLAFLKTIPAIDRIIVGAVSVTQLVHILNCFNNHSDVDLPDIGTRDEALVNPSRWVLP